MSFFIKDDEVWEKYEKKWDLIKNKLGTKFNGQSVYDRPYIKAKVTEFDGVIKTNFLGNDQKKICIILALLACITIDSVMKIDLKKIIRRFI